MKPDSTKQAFLEHLKNQSYIIDELLPNQGVDVMLSFYKLLRIDGCDIEEDGDMLLYQWGTYDWEEGESFEFNITRQLIIDDYEDDNIWQLSLTFKYIPDGGFKALESDEFWCNTPGGIMEFEKIIKESKPYQKIKSVTPEKVELLFECAG